MWLRQYQKGRFEVTVDTSDLDRISIRCGASRGLSWSGC